MLWLDLHNDVGDVVSQAILLARWRCASNNHPQEERFNTFRLSSWRDPSLGGLVFP